MTISARLDRKTVAALERFCKANKITKTQAIERGITVLLEQSQEQAHPAFLAYQQLKLVPEARRSSVQRSSEVMRDTIRAKYSR
jgi:hypothetical protein